MRSVLWVELHGVGGTASAEPDAGLGQLWAQGQAERLQQGPAWPRSRKPHSLAFRRGACWPCARTPAPAAALGGGLSTARGGWDSAQRRSPDRAGAGSRLWDGGPACCQLQPGLRGGAGRPAASASARPHPGSPGRGLWSSPGDPPGSEWGAVGGGGAGRSADRKKWVIRTKTKQRCHAKCSFTLKSQSTYEKQC